MKILGKFVEKDTVYIGEFDEIYIRQNSKTRYGHGINRL